MNDIVVQFAIRVLKTNHISVCVLNTDCLDTALVFDLGVRNGICCDESETRVFLQKLRTMLPYTVYHITDSFGCLYTALRLPETDSEILLIGPTMENEEWEKLSDIIGAKRKLPPEMQQQLKDYYLRLPKLSLISGYHSVVLELGKHLYGDQMNTRYIQDDSQPTVHSAGRVAPVSKVGKPIISMQMMEERYEAENSLLEAIRHGNSTLALRALEYFNGITVPYRPNAAIADSVKFHLVGLNAMLRKEAERTEVHPLYLNELSDEILTLASEVNTEQSEYQLAIQMVDRYCELVKRYALTGYSPIVRNVIRYANGHINADLSLRTLAERFNVNRSYLSSLFKKETGISFTEYINSLRIEVAAGLLTNQQLSIAEVAEMVGFAEVSYFNRLFKRIKNQTPAQYVKDVRKRVPH